MSSVCILVNIYVESHIFYRFIICVMTHCCHVLASVYHSNGIHTLYSFDHGQYRNVAGWALMPDHRMN
jgi:hypothetical protein